MSSVILALAAAGQVSTATPADTALAQVPTQIALPTVESDKASTEALVDALPDTPTTAVLDRFSADQRQALIWAARKEIATAKQDAAAGLVTADKAVTRITDALTVRTALVGAALDARVRELGPTALKSLSPSQITTIAYSDDPEQLLTLQGLLGGKKPNEVWGTLIAGINEKAVKSPYETTPEPSTGIAPQPPADGSPPVARLSTLVDRRSLNGVVGLGKQTVSGLQFHCSGIALSARYVLTARHCVSGTTLMTTGPFVVFTAFTGGSQTAKRVKDKRTFTNLSAHPVKGISSKHNDTKTGGTPPWAYDIAILEIDGSGLTINQAGLPRPASAFTDHPIMTGAGWGFTDATVRNGVPLEAGGIIIPRGSAKPMAPTSRGWSQASAQGGTFCRADSGGPIFEGAPDNSGRITPVLIGLVSGGQDCLHGTQIVTDMTLAATRAYVCEHARSTPYCGATNIAMNISAPQLASRRRP